jgi:hypothetical protein
MLIIRRNNRLIIVKILVIFFLKLISTTLFSQTNTYVKSLAQKHHSVFESQIIDEYKNTSDTIVIITFTVNKTGEVFKSEIVKVFCNSCDSSTLIRVNEIIYKTIDEIKKDKWEPNKSEQKFYVPINIKNL